MWSGSLPLVSIIMRRAAVEADATRGRLNPLVKTDRK
jgi:hypothetical protein